MGLQLQMNTENLSIGMVPIIRMFKLLEAANSRRKEKSSEKEDLLTLREDLKQLQELSLDCFKLKGFFLAFLTEQKKDIIMMKKTSITTTTTTESTSKGNSQEIQDILQPRFSVKA